MERSALSACLEDLIHPAEIAVIRAHAEVAGIKPTTHIRRCALADEQPPIDRTQLTRTVAALSPDLEDLRRTAG